MFKSFLQRIAPLILMMAASSGISTPRRPRLATVGGRPSELKFNGSGTTLVRAEKKQGRNDACACGSGKKFKKCCGG